MTPIVIREIGGACPFQAYGTFYGCPFYLRARHGEWTLDVCRPGDDPVRNGELLHLSGDDDTGGFMDYDEGLRILGVGFTELREKYWEQFYKGANFPARKS